MKKFLALLLVLSMVFTLCACGKKTDDSKYTGKLVVYSPHDADPLNAGVAQFKEKYPNIDVEVIAAGTGELCQRIVAEAANPQGDVLWGGGADTLAARLAALPGVRGALPQLTEQAFAIAGNSQMPVTLTGVVQGWDTLSGVADITIDGAPRVLQLSQGLSAALLSVGAATGLQTTPKSPWAVTIYEPRRTGRYNPANPAGAFVADTIVCLGVFRVEQEEYDRDMIVVPLDVSRRLLEYTGGEASGIAVWGDAGVSDAALLATLRSALAGRADLKVLDRFGQQPDIFRMIGVEKWITFAMLVFILLVAAFNIVSTLSMMVLEKQSNMGVMRAMGATDSLISRIFANQGWLITLAGGLIGLCAGTLLSLGQEHFGWVKLNAIDPSMLSITAYPVATQWGDILTVAAVTAGASALMALVGALLPRKQTQKPTNR